MPSVWRELLTFKRQQWEDNVTSHYRVKYEREKAEREKLEITCINVQEHKDEESKKKHKAREKKEKEKKRLLSSKILVTASLKMEVKSTVQKITTRCQSSYPITVLWLVKYLTKVPVAILDR